MAGNMVIGWELKPQEGSGGGGRGELIGWEVKTRWNSSEVLIG